MNLKFLDLGVPDGQKTRRYRVTSNMSGFSLGQIRFYGAWRKFCFFPDENTVFDASCLQEIIEFCVTKTLEWRG